MIARRLAACAAAALLAASCDAASLRACEQPAEFSAAQKDVILRFAAVVKERLAASGASVALVARSGMDLHRLHVRYSHEGVALREPGGPWSVRELYYACDERRPRIYDEGLAGFLLGTDDARTGWISIVLLPPAPAQALARTATDKRHALGVLGATYSANAYPFSTRFQNCNQWVMELLAAAWAPLQDADDLRARAQQWLGAQGYAPDPVDVGSHLLMFAAPFFPLVHLDDHPPDDRFALQLRTSLPRSIEAFVHRRLPQARRIELCHDERQVVVRQGWQPLAEGCRAEEGDRVIAFD